MKPEILALITAFCWGVGGFFEKKGLLLGNLPPITGIFIRSFIAALVLGAVGFNKLNVIKTAGFKALAIMVVFGGVMAGSLGMLFFYKAIKAGELSRVMPIAFTSPLFGALAGIIFSGESITLKKAAGMLLTIGGIVLLTL